MRLPRVLSHGLACLSNFAFLTTLEKKQLFLEDRHLFLLPRPPRRPRPAPGFLHLRRRRRGLLCPRGPPVQPRLHGRVLGLGRRPGPQGLHQEVEEGPLGLARARRERRHALVALGALGRRHRRGREDPGPRVGRLRRRALLLARRDVRRGRREAARGQAGRGAQHAAGRRRTRAPGRGQEAQGGARPYAEAGGGRGGAGTGGGADPADRREPAGAVRGRERERMREGEREGE